jgi:galacturan 1,4-alpha-galacturonidase
MKILSLQLISGALALQNSQHPQVHIRSLAAPAQDGPRIVIGPKGPYKPMPVSAPRTKVCTVTKSGGNDDSSAILSALQQCNNGGKVVLSRGSRYTIGKALDLRFLNSVDLVIAGELSFSSDTAYWQRSAFKYGYQNAASYIILGGTDVNLYGGGTIDGNGGPWKQVFANNKNAIRPIPLVISGMNGGSVSNLKMRNSAQWFNLIMNSRNVVYSDLDISGKTKNSDGWDTVSKAFLN